MSLISYLPVRESSVIKEISANVTVIGPYWNKKQLMAGSQQANKEVDMASSKGMVS